MTQAFRVNSATGAHGGTRVRFVTHFSDEPEILLKQVFERNLRFGGCWLRRVTKQRLRFFLPRRVGYVRQVTDVERLF